MTLEFEARTRALVVMAAAVFVAITTEVLPIGLLPVVADGLHATESQVGLLVSGYAVVVAVMSIPLASVAARWPRRHVLAVLLLTYAVSNAVFAATSSYPLAVVTRLVAGLAHAGFFSAVFAAAVAVVPRERSGRALSIVNAGVVLALAAGIPLGTALGTAFGWRWTFGGASVALLVLAVLVERVVPDDDLATNDAAESVLSAARRPALVVVAAGIVLLTLGHYTAYTYVSPILRHAGVGRDAISVVLLGYGVASIGGLLLARTVIDRRPKAGLQLGAALLVLTLVALGLGGASIVVTVVAAVVWGVAFGALPLLAQAVALLATPQTPDAAPAIVNATFNVGIAGGAFIGSRELLSFAPPTVALTGAALAAAGMIVPVVVNSRHAPREHAQPSAVESC